MWWQNSPEKHSPASTTSIEASALSNTADVQLLKHPDIKKVLAKSWIGEKITSMIDSIHQIYKPDEYKTQLTKFVSDIQNGAELDDDDLIIESIERWRVIIENARNEAQRGRVNSERDSIISEKDETKTINTGEIQKIDETKTVNTEEIQKKDEIHTTEIKDAKQENLVANKGSERITEALIAAVAKHKQRIQELTGDSPESIIGAETYRKEIAKNEVKISEEYGDTSKLPQSEQARIKKEISAKAESLTIFEHQGEILKKCPAENQKELQKIFTDLIELTGLKRPSISEPVGADPKISASEYQLAKTIAGDRRDIYQDGRITRAVADEKGTYPSFIPGQGLYMNADHLKIRIQLAPEDELRVNNLQSAEIKDKIQLDALKNEDNIQRNKLQSYESVAWLKIQKEWSLATRWVQEILLQKWINFMKPELSRDTLTKESIAALRNDPKLRAEIQKGAEDGSEFAPAEFFNGLDLLAVSFKQSNDESQLKRTSAINQLQTKFNSKNPESYSNLTKSIYEQAYATARKNLLVLTEDFGLDAAGQQFVDRFLDILNEHRGGVAKLNLSKELTADKKKDIALALNALIKSNPPLFSVQNGEIGTQISPVERKRAILRGLREQKFLLPPDDRVSETSIRNALGAR